ncbi:HD domain-containing phosphohydrolase [Leptothrix discophora]|uniref:Response regulator n=1 Tax=Leptothrix discophora TaxID=89 RepID=A0ABT9G802_LEPDI|nr:HD domain-containing phosphohydrolase [Leptothrix discophora]MDP4302402.1 response regulator [Leptothrix discophora]
MTVDAPDGRGAGTTVLCVDDEANILASLKRVLRGAGHQVLSAPGGAEALEILSRRPVDVVISDMRMPGMDGAQLLEAVRARWPQVVRILLTGHADMASTVAAINRGQILRFVHKPWDEAELLGAVAEGLERLALQRERDRLEALTRSQNDALKDLNAELESRVQARTAELAEANDKLRRNHLKAIRVFSSLLELRGAQLAGHGRRVAEMARDIARKMGLPEAEVMDIFVAGLLHDIGQIGLGDALLGRPLARYDDTELAAYRRHPMLAEPSLMALDDLQALVPLIRSHHERHDGSGFPDKLAGAAIPLGSRILAIADAFDDLQNGHLADVRLTALEARTVMRRARGTQFDPEVLDVFLHLTEPAPPAVRIPPLPTAALEPAMVLSQDLISGRGLLMLTAGHTLTASLINRIREFEAREGSVLDVHVAPRG